MARIERHNDENVREVYIRNGCKEVKLFTSALKDFQCNNRIVMAQRKPLMIFLRCRIIGRLECGRTLLEISEKLGGRGLVCKSDYRRTLYGQRHVPVSHQENPIERHRYGGVGWLVWGRNYSCGSRTDLHVQIVTMTGPIYRDVIVEQHVRLFRGAMGAEFLFIYDNARPHHANIVDECLQLE
ncbi:transposable element Tcb1 transposase [Trichonephila clavipes]|nr:transposable element Tcb1 transposase [Trichonephila clavipes]